MRLLIDHLRKTAGTSLSDYFRIVLGEAAVTPLIIDESIQIAPPLFERFKVVTGHFHLVPEYAWPKGIYVATILRDPIDRLISHYSYVRETREADEPFAQLAKAHSLAELLQSDSQVVRDACSDPYCRHFLAGMRGPGSAGSDGVVDAYDPSAVDVSDVADFVSDRYQFVGLSEHLQLSSAVICFDNAVKADLLDVRSRRTVDRVGVDALDGPTRKAAEAMLSNDLALYRRFAPAFFKRLERVAQGAVNRYPSPVRAVTTPRETSATTPMAVSLGAELVCPERPRNDIATAGLACWLTVKLANRTLPSRVVVTLKLETSLKQTAFRQWRKLDLGDQPAPTLQLTWDFVCHLGRDEYAVSVDFQALDQGGHPAGPITRLDEIYRFRVEALDPSALGVCMLDPSLDWAGMSAEVERCDGTVAARIVGQASDREAEMEFELVNTGQHVWRRSGVNAVALVLFVTGEADDPEQQSPRIYLKEDVPPGATASMRLPVGRVGEGAWSVRARLVQERIRWFADLDAPIVIGGPKQARAKPKRRRST